ncbi:hypothetical protein Hanom_Chr17g01528701 [Helianthus anomalus]
MQFEYFVAISCFLIVSLLYTLSVYYSHDMHVGVKCINAWDVGDKSEIVLILTLFSLISLN